MHTSWVSLSCAYSPCCAKKVHTNPEMEVMSFPVTILNNTLFMMQASEAHKNIQTAWIQYHTIYWDCGLQLYCNRVVYYGQDDSTCWQQGQISKIAVQSAWLDWLVTRLSNWYIDSWLTCPPRDHRWGSKTQVALETHRVRGSLSNSWEGKVSNLVTARVVTWLYSGQMSHWSPGHSEGNTQHHFWTADSTAPVFLWTRGSCSSSANSVQPLENEQPNNDLSPQQSEQNMSLLLLTCFIKCFFVD